ncbi:MAG: DUF1272 domain-containing protein [Saprospiraceae bacterium]|nr:DUF1272 domain-containing protein [Saprospiraceae bacterium]
MLELRPNCEHCDKNLPNTSTEAMICSFECTYCFSCAMELFKNVCPSCGGNFQPRPIRPAVELGNHPVSTTRIHHPKNLETLQAFIQKYEHIPAQHR